MDEKILQELYRSRHVEVEVVGKKQGDFIVVVIITKCGTKLPLSDKTVSQPKTFKTPEYVISFLEKLNIQRYTVNLKHWDSSQMFDKHRRAHELRLKKANAVA